MECMALVHVASSLRGFLHFFQFWCADLRTVLANPRLLYGMHGLGACGFFFSWLVAFLPVCCADLRTVLANPRLLYGMHGLGARGLFFTWLVAFLPVLVC